MAWDKNKPSGSQKLRLSDDELRANFSALEDALKNGAGLEFSTGGAQTGKLLKPIFKALSSDPAPPGGTNELILYDKEGRLYFIDAAGVVYKVLTDQDASTGGGGSVDYANTAGYANDSDKVDGYHAQSTPAPNVVPVADANGKLDAWVSSSGGGNADTVDGYDTSTTPAPNVIPISGPDGTLNAWVTLGGNYVSLDDYVFSPGIPGYTVFPTGFVMQWGYTGPVSGDGGSFYVSFPITFPHMCFSVVSVPDGLSSGGGTEDYWGVGGVSASGFTQINYYDASLNIFWIAVGY